MKLLFDQNLSRNLVAALSAVYPDSSHVAFSGLETADDRAVWDYAKEHGFAIVSKDMDFTALRRRSCGFASATARPEM